MRDCVKDTLMNIDQKCWIQKQQCLCVDSDSVENVHIGHRRRSRNRRLESQRMRMIQKKWHFIMLHALQSHFYITWVLVINMKVIGRRRRCDNLSKQRRCIHKISYHNLYYTDDASFSPVSFVFPSSLLLYLYYFADIFLNLNN